MAKSIEELLTYVNELEQEMRDTVEELKSVAKEDAMSQIQDLLTRGNSGEAKQLIDDIENLGSLTLSVNIGSINEYILTMLNMDSEKRRFTNNKSGHQFNFHKKEEKEDVKEVMKRKGFKFCEYKEGTLKFEKDSDYFFTIEIDNSMNDEYIENTLNDTNQLTNLIFITETENDKKMLKNKVRNWINKRNDRDTLKKYLQVQVGSFEYLKQKGTVLEKMNLA